MRVAKLHSSDSKERDKLKRTILGDLDSWDACITTYDMCAGDLNRVLATQHVWRYVVLDEGHKVCFHLRACVSMQCDRFLLSENLAEDA